MDRPSLRALWRESHASSALLAGLLASIPAAFVSAAVLFAADLLYRRTLGTTLLTVGEVAGATTWLGSFAVHLAVSAFFGAVFGVLVAFTAHHIAPVAGAAWGAFYGLLVWLVWFVLIVPWVNRSLAAQTRTALLWHLAYGATLGFFFHHARMGERKKHRLPSRPPVAGTAPRLR